MAALRGSAVVLALTSCITAITVFTLLARRKPRGPLPPGPPKLPIIGNILQVPSEKGWMQYAEWGRQYGSIISLSMLGQTLVILNSYEDATELLATRSVKYSDRPVLQMGGELMGWSNVLNLVGSGGDRLRRIQKEIHKVIGTPKALSNHHSVLEHETLRFLRNVGADPASLNSHIRRSSGAVILRLTYGYTVNDTGDDPLVKSIERAVLDFSLAASPGAFFVDIFPPLRHIPEWFPGAGFKRKAKVWRQTFLDTLNTPVEYVKNDMAAGKPNDSFVAKLLEDSNGSEEQEDLIKYIGIALYAGGGDTVVAAIRSFFLAMTLYPEAMKAAQAELDSVIGIDRLPKMEDRPNLPYVDALAQEVSRWHTLGPLGFHHRLTEDDVYKGYLIPRGSLVLANIWQMLHNPDVYKEPMTFRPERFLGPNPEFNPFNMCFGFGRRLCPGRVLAEESIFLTCAMTLAVFDMTKTIEDGVVVEPVYDQTSGMVSHPKEFRCDITPRSGRTKQLIKY